MGSSCGATGPLLRLGDERGVGPSRGGAPSWGDAAAIDRERVSRLGALSGATGVHLVRPPVVAARGQPCL